MSPKKVSLLVLAVLMLVLPACTRSASTPPATTPTTQGLVQPVTPNATEDPMKVLAGYATQTSMAAAGTILPSPTAIGGAAVATQGGVLLPTATTMGALTTPGTTAVT